MKAVRGAKALLDWLDGRTGYRRLVRAALVEPIPGGAKWKYVWGSALTFAVAVQFVTGLALWASYSPNAQGAWESVFHIQHNVAGGWMLRGIHHYMAHATMILLVLHLMQIVVAGAYRAPREVNFWFGIALLHVVLGLSLTGYLLPWDQKGYWATKVATSIASITPLVGPALQEVLVGGRRLRSSDAHPLLRPARGRPSRRADRADRGSRVPLPPSRCDDGRAARRWARHERRTDPSSQWIARRVVLARSGPA